MNINIFLVIIVLFSLFYNVNGNLTNPKSGIIHYTIFKQDINEEIYNLTKQWKNLLFSLQEKYSNGYVFFAKEYNNDYVNLWILEDKIEFMIKKYNNISLTDREILLSEMYGYDGKHVLNTKKKKFLLKQEKIMLIRH